MMAYAKHGLEFLQRGVRMFFDVRLKFIGVELAPFAPTGFGRQRALLGAAIRYRYTELRARSNRRAASALVPPFWTNFTTRSRKSNA